MDKVTRRSFLGGTAAAGSMLLAGGFAARPLEAADDAGWPPLPPVKIHVVYVGTGGAWPTPGGSSSSIRQSFRVLGTRFIYTLQSRKQNDPHAIQAGRLDWLRCRAVPLTDSEGKVHQRS